jgi:hypothetical protein
MRVQHVGVHVPGGGPQFHAACTHLKVVDGGRHLLPKQKTMRIPGLFTREDSGFNVNIFVDFRGYKTPRSLVQRR